MRAPIAALVDDFGAGANDGGSLAVWHSGVDFDRYWLSNNLPEYWEELDDRILAVEAAIERARRMESHLDGLQGEYSRLHEEWQQQCTLLEGVGSHTLPPEPDRSDLNLLEEVCESLVDMAEAACWALVQYCRSVQLRQQLVGEFEHQVERLTEDNQEIAGNCIEYLEKYTAARNANDFYDALLEWLHEAGYLNGSPLKHVMEFDEPGTQKLPKPMREKRDMWRDRARTLAEFLEWLETEKRLIAGNGSRALVSAEQLAKEWCESEQGPC